MGYVTREMIDRAKEMDLLTYLQTYEPQELVHFGGSTYCTREHDSLKISNGKWCWFSRGIGGRTALDYLIKVKEIPFTEAVERIVGRAAGQPPISCTRQQPEQTKTLLLPQVSRCAAHAVEYLHSRGIDYELIDFCIRTGRLYESYPHHNAVFVGKDKDGQPRYACLRGIGTDFKGEATGSDKRFSFSIPAEESSQVLYLFESAIDLLSFAAMAQEDRLPWRSQHLLSLAGVYQPKKNLTERHLPLALSQYLRDHREIQTIYLCLDNDLAGRSAADAIRQQLAGRYVVLDGFPCQGKDYNDWLCLRKGLPITRTVSKPERSISKSPRYPTRRPSGRTCPARRKRVPASRFRSRRIPSKTRMTDCWMRCFRVPPTGRRRFVKTLRRLARSAPVRPSLLPKPERTQKGRLRWTALLSGRSCGRSGVDRRAAVFPPSGTSRSRRKGRSSPSSISSLRRRSGAEKVRSDNDGKF